MFVTYYSNQPEIQKDILVSLLENLPQHDPFQSDIVLVQSPVWHNGYKWKLLKTRCCSEFPIPHAFQFYLKLYADNLPNVSTQNPFEKDSTLWRLMRLIPTFTAKEFEPLKIFSLFTRIRTAKTLSISFQKLPIYLTNISSIALNGLPHGKKNNDEKILAQINQQSRAFRR